MEKMPHTKGRWAARRERLVLAGWQCFIVCNLFGWCDLEGLRRFREAYLKIARKNGKSLLAAAIGHYMFTMDGEYGAEVYSGATTLKQAMEVYGPAKVMAEKLTKYTASKKITVGAKNMHIIANNSKFEPLIGDPGDGANPSCAIVDEYHEHLTNNLVETMTTGMGAREQPLLLIITTSGSNIGGPCFDTELESQKILDKVYSDETTFVMIYGIDADDDWTDPAILDKANPNIDVAVSRDFLENQLRAATRSPLKQNAFKRKHLNMWVGAHTAWLNMEDFLACADPEMKIEDFVGDDMVLPVDLASKIDITATPRIFTRVIDGNIHYYYFSKYYIPEETAAKDENKHFQKYINAGELIPTDGNEIDFNEIQEDLAIDIELFNPFAIPYDPWRATQLAQGLKKRGGPVVLFKNTVGNMSPAMYELEAAIIGGRFHYDGNSMTAWMASNVIARIDAKENVYPRKQKTENKIDGIVAAIMGVGSIIAEREPAQDIDDFINDPVTG
jgi:phage terminase large subunit-like protein